jgi:stage II sporulation protein D
LELRYTPATDKVWVINELPIESYLKGIAETSNVSPQEYQRALLTGARTYAMYHVQRGTKHANEYYIVDATYDQVYRGYGAEARGSNIVAAVDATRGQIVTFDGKLAITPYYSRSDGRTRSWGEVWYGGSNYPWLVSVPVPWDVGRTLWGHGVGLSATGALAAANEGWTYDRILKHFYTGIELRRAYK